MQQHPLLYIPSPGQEGQPFCLHWVTPKEQFHSPFHPMAVLRLRRLGLSFIQFRFSTIIRRPILLPVCFINSIDSPKTALRQHDFQAKSTGRKYFRKTSRVSKWETRFPSARKYVGQCHIPFMICFPTIHLVNLAVSTRV